MNLGETGEGFDYDEAVVGMEGEIADEYMEMAQQHFIDYPEAYADPPERRGDKILPPFDSDAPILDPEDEVLINPLTVYTIMAVIILIALIASGAVVMLRLGL